MIRMVDLIRKKEKGMALLEDEIAFFVRGVTDASIPDYQTAAFLMAVYFKGMDKTETALLTRHMARSGDMVDLSAIRGVKVDKHSTGGVGDKTTLVTGPIVAACGGVVAKLSGRGLGHTGGTVDKLESIPGIKTEMARDAFVGIVNRTGLCVVGQSGNLAPADKRLYALRDVTATVESLPLIASSIMSKKLAAGADVILLDVKTGSGAFMKTAADARALAKAMVEIGTGEGRRVSAFITDMDVPLGSAVGNALEVAEAVRTLKGEGPEDLVELCTRLAAEMLRLSGIGDTARCAGMAERAMRDGSAFRKLREMVAAQGGDPAVLDDTSLLCVAPFAHTVKAEREGYISRMDTERCGNTAAMLGAGRLTKESHVDHAAGIVLCAKTGDFVREGGALAEMYASDRSLFPVAEKELLGAFLFSDQPPRRRPVVLEEIR